MSKIVLDKYYTPIYLSKYCIDKTYDVIGIENITEIIEPSAGNGSFSNQMENCIAYDIAPEGENIIKQDYLALDLKYKKGRLIIGNPPYGTRNTMSVKFFKKSIQLCDYISFILPASQYMNNNQLYEFDLVHSELISNENFTHLDKRIKLTFNIYKRPSYGLNKKPNYKLKDVVIKEARRGIKNNIDVNFDTAMCSFGWSIGKKPKFISQYSNEFYFYINNEKFKEEVIDLIENTNWMEVINCVTGIEKINQWQVYKYIKEKIPLIN